MVLLQDLVGTLTEEKLLQRQIMSRVKGPERGGYHRRDRVVEGKSTETLPHWSCSQDRPCPLTQFRVDPPTDTAQYRPVH